MRNFLSFIRDSEKTRLDIFCYDEKEVPGLDEILRKKFKFFIYRTDRDSILAFRTGEYSGIKDIMQKLEKFYGFEWAGEPLIYDTVEKKSSKKF
ncbi:hypothetical protein ES695_02760 [Candidatus Atribacteria bacterium 1244-E10-H5-B2]|nr:MAG: hypothetical protein ES695_02760 [Candidatus Atribacteria bacterium 1244-E10-H5-B2]